MLEATELHKLFSELGLRERAMIVLEALTGIRRSGLMDSSGRMWTARNPAMLATIRVFKRTH
jgi:hypothetical protein